MSQACRGPEISEGVPLTSSNEGGEEALDDLKGDETVLASDPFVDPSTATLDSPVTPMTQPDRFPGLLSIRAPPDAL